MRYQRNYYQVLGMEQTASPEEIKKAYRRLSKKYHPDMNPESPEARKRFQEISEAYAVLGNEEKRKAYDKRLQDNRGRKREEEGQKGKQQRNASRGVEFDIHSMSESFERFFGFHPESREVKEEQMSRQKKKGTNPLDMTEMFEKYMRMKD
ncbi:MAG: DnaJ domain-containing protein [Kineothrix sp.]